MRPREMLTAFDRYLAGRRLRLEAVVIGGAALNLVGLVSRPTRCLGRDDLIRSNLFALCDRGIVARRLGHVV